MKDNSSSIKRFLKQLEEIPAFFKQRFVLHHLLSHGGKQLIEKYRNYSPSDSENITEYSPVWVCWWQGQEKMPDIAKACYNSICQHAGSHPVILITFNNYQDYVSFPPYILERHKRGEIDYTHLSDILRMMLLQEHGGIWIDSTVLITDKELGTFIDSKAKFWSCHHRPVTHNVSRGGWVSYFLASGKGHLLPTFILDMHLLYWKTHSKLINYLLLDYTFAIARAHLPAVRNMIEALPVTRISRLKKCLNEPYTEKQWKEFCTNYDFHKLSYKMPLKPTTPDGRKTFYGHIMETYFPKTQ